MSDISIQIPLTILSFIVQKEQRPNTSNKVFFASLCDLLQQPHPIYTMPNTNFSSPNFLQTKKNYISSIENPKIS